MDSSSYSADSSPFSSEIEAVRGSARSRPARARFFCDGLDDEEPRHFLDSCFLCRKSLAGNRDIFMYRGDMPFCSEECRQEQIEMDEAKEKNRKLSQKASSKKDSDTAAAAANDVHVRTDTAVVAG
ncbi:FCS-Like Zinc finger 3-like [Zingiber officinale]|uniref:FLZ-type domain-containing protein n=1 Tax=Zingiber officinale TaxID=94328 RepID=A0A8J5FDZ0_ZINOF|nr:FCS-Like Zinc finger 3-like [Zingiber officinale]KAG6485502.1 hypothetical protein ZIOFF_054040 [Zingiber officinale]